MKTSPTQTPTQVDRYRRWFEYEKEAHAKVVRSLESVPADRRDGAEFRRAVSILGHIVAARHVWLFRLGEVPTAPKEFFPQGESVTDISARLNDIQEKWTAYMGRLTDADLERNFEYKSLDAGRVRNRIEDILTQLYGHSLYHRGQIAMLVRTAGGEPAATDFVYWCREAIG